MIKTILFFFTVLFFITVLPAQNLKVSSGTTLTVKSGTIFSVDSLVLIPSTDFALSDISINKTTTVTHTAPYTYIARVYNFNGTSNAFTGDIRINYKDGAELNGIFESALSLNIHNGSIWKGYTPTTRDGTLNFVLTNGLSAVMLSDVTLADAAFPLPLNWLSFTAVKKNETALLHWITAQEQNTKNFTVQHSTDGVNWSAIGTVPASGSGNGNYSFIHTTPVNGINYYRILQTDLNNRFSYSEIRIVNFASGAPFVILNNPATGGTVSVQVNTATVLSMYAADGKLVWIAKVNTGLYQINVAQFAKGTYLLVNTERVAQKIIIQ